MLALEGLNEIVSTKPSLLPAEVTDFVVGYHHFSGNSEEISKCWSNIMIELVENDEEGLFEAKLSMVVPRLVQGLTFSEQDEKNLKEEMELEYNPYI